MVVLLAGLVIAGLVWLARRQRDDRAPAGGGPSPGFPDPAPGGPPVSPDLMPRGRIEVSGLTKEYRGIAAVRDLSFVVEPGRVTGFLGPNGAGKSTTLRMLLGLAEPAAGTALIGGVRYGDLAEPVRRVGGVLEADGAHQGRTSRDHLCIICRSAGLPLARADEVLARTGLSAVGGRRFGGYSLGMRQRLGIAAALLGDPQVLILDEPANGLDPEGIRWLRGLLRSLAAGGRTVLLSSHLLAEVEQLADEVIIIAGGRLITQGTVASVIGSMSWASRTLVRSPDMARLAAELGGDATLTPAGDGDFYVTGVSAAEIGDAAQRAGLALGRARRRRADHPAGLRAGPPGLGARRGGHCAHPGHRRDDRPRPGLPARAARL